MRRFRGLAIRFGLSALALVVLGLSLFLLQLQRPVVIPVGVPGGELAYMSAQDDNWEIYILDSSGNTRNISNDPAGDYFPSWAFDSQRINFLSARGGAEIEPAQVEPDGSNARTLSILQAVSTVFFEGRLDWDPQWSPSFLAWSSVRDFNLEIYVQGLEDDDAQRLTDNPARDWYAAWSPDGERLLFSSDREGNENIYMINRDGSGLTQLTDHAADDLRPFWSADGTRIGFVSERDHMLLDGVMDLFMMNTDGSGQEPLTDTWDSAPAWSPDGSQAVFMSNRSGKWQLYLREAACAADDCLQRLTDDRADVVFPVWRP